MVRGQSSKLNSQRVIGSGPGQTGTGTVGYSDSWVQGQTGTGTNGYRCDSWVQGQTGTSGATNGYRDNRVQVRQTGTETNGYKKNAKKKIFESVKAHQAEITAHSIKNGL